MGDGHAEEMVREDRRHVRSEPIEDLDSPFCPGLLLSKRPGDRVKGKPLPPVEVLKDFELFGESGLP